MTARRVLVILNARAGGGDQDGVADQVREGLRARGVEAEIFDSSSEEATKRRVGEALAEPRQFDAIVAAGGDHTVRSVAFELLETEMPLGILPLGTAMNIARTLDLPLELEPALDVLAHGEPRPIDVGYVGDQPFLEIATIGLAAELLDDATAVSEGRLNAARALLGRFVRHRRTRVWLDLDGRPVMHRVVSLAIANGRFTGRALEVAPDARLDDGLLDVICYLGFGPLEVLRELAKVALGLGRGSRTVTYRARRVAIRSHHPLPVRADSNHIGTTPTIAATRPRSILVIEEWSSRS